MQSETQRSCNVLTRETMSIALISAVHAAANICNRTAAAAAAW
jgi:hypothetical protein